MDSVPKSSVSRTLFLHFAVSFSGVKKSRRLKFLYPLLYIPGATLGILRWMSLRVWEPTEKLQLRLDKVDCAYLVSFYILAAIVFRVRYRKEHQPLERQQLKWLMSGAIVTLACAAVTFGLSGALSGAVGIWRVLANFGWFGFAALPVSIGVGILKYRLYEIDRLISRTLAYAIVTGLLVGLYAGLVLLTTRVLPFSSPVGVAASTLVAVALFTPLRRRVQKVVDRRFNRARYDADAAVAAFAARLTGAVDLDTVRTDLAGVVRQALEPVHVSVWIAGRGPR